MGGTLQFTDVAADAKDWANLGLADSKTYIALGLKVASITGWTTYDTNTWYAVETGQAFFGQLGINESGLFTLVANYGLAFDQNFTAKHNLVFLFDLA